MILQGEDAFSLDIILTRKEILVQHTLCARECDKKWGFERRENISDMNETGLVCQNIMNSFW